MNLINNIRYFHIILHTPGNLCGLISRDICYSMFHWNEVLESEIFRRVELLRDLGLRTCPASPHREAKALSGPTSLIFKKVVM